MQKALIKVELTVKLFIHSVFLIQNFKKIQTLKPIAFSKTSIQYIAGVSSLKDTKAACKLFYRPLFDSNDYLM